MKVFNLYKTVIKAFSLYEIATLM